MTRRRNHAFKAAAIAAVFICSTAARAESGDQQLVIDYLTSIGAESEYYVIYPLGDDYIGRTFPNFSFFAVQFTQWPYMVLVPDPLPGPSNVFIVRNGHVSFLDGVNGLENFFSAQLPPLPDATSATDAGRAWLRLSEEFKQDRFFQFSDPAVDYTPTSNGASVTGAVLVLDGGTGRIDLTMTLDGAGNLVDIQETSTVRAGVRPICQATKLLDRDSLVRRMAEQDILVMGRAAKSYLDAQRAKARPALKRAIDRIWARIVEEGR
jgi:hypothetical protein